MCLTCGCSYCETHGDEHYHHKRCRHAWYLHLNADVNDIFCRGCDAVLEIPEEKELESAENISADVVKRIKLVQALCDKLQRIRKLEPTADEDEEQDEDEEEDEEDEEDEEASERVSKGSSVRRVPSRPRRGSKSGKELEMKKSHELVSGDIFSLPPVAHTEDIGVEMGDADASESSAPIAKRTRRRARPPPLFRASSVAGAAAALAASAVASDEEDDEDEEAPATRKLVTRAKRRSTEKGSSSGPTARTFVPDGVAHMEQGPPSVSFRTSGTRKSVAGQTFTITDDVDLDEDDVNTDGSESPPSALPTLVRNPSLSLQLSLMSETPRVVRRGLKGSKANSPALLPMHTPDGISLGQSHPRSLAEDFHAISDDVPIDELSRKRIRQDPLAKHGAEKGNASEEDDLDGLNIVVRGEQSQTLNFDASAAFPPNVTPPSLQRHDTTSFLTTNLPIPKAEDFPDLLKDRIIDLGTPLLSGPTRRMTRQTTKRVKPEDEADASKRGSKRAPGEPGEFGWLKFLSVEAARQREKTDLLYTACFRWKYGKLMNAFAEWRAWAAAQKARHSQVRRENEGTVDLEAESKEAQAEHTAELGKRVTRSVARRVGTPAGDELHEQATMQGREAERTSSKGVKASPSAESFNSNPQEERDKTEDEDSMEAAAKVDKQQKSRGIFNTRGVCGLRNLGNTCYLNAVLQAFSHTDAIRAYFLAHVDEHREHSFLHEDEDSMTDKSKSPGRFAFRPPKVHSEQHNCCWTVEAPQPPAWSRTAELGNRRRRPRNGHPPESEEDDTDRTPGDNNSMSNDPKSELTAITGNSQTPLSDCVAHLLHTLWTGKRLVFSPDSMIHKVWALQPRFRGFIQHDAQEFTLFFLDQLSKEQKLHREKLPLPAEYRALDPARLEVLERNAEKKAADLRRAEEARRNGNAITDLPPEQDAEDPPIASFHDMIKNQFTGATRTRIDCLECGHVAVTDSPFLGVLSLFLPENGSNWVPPSQLRAVEAQERDRLESQLGDSNSVPQDESSGDMEPTPTRRRTTRSRAEPVMKLTLEDLFDFNYSTVERLEGNNAYRCDKCNKHTSAELRSRIGALPSRYLLLHIVRTSFDTKTFRPKKNQSEVRFPLKDLDLGKYLDRHGEPQADGTGATGRSESYKYDLFALVTHHGKGMQEGHFTSCAWNPLAQSWLFFNDAIVKRITPEELQNLQAYMLFYRRQDD